MIRNFNYTGRRKIHRAQVAIQLVRQSEGEVPAFNLTKLELEDMPADASVFVEAYHKTSFMRFPYGTVASQKIPANRSLKEIQSPDMVSFRVKVVDETGRHGRLLATVDGISPRAADESGAVRLGLMDVRYEDLGQEIWQMDFEGERPAIVINKNLDKVDIAYIVRNDSQFFSLVYPAAIHQILEYIVLEREDMADIDGDPEEDWGVAWLRYACQLPGVGSPPSDSETTEEKRRWAGVAVAEFCKAKGVADLYADTKSKEKP